jgi:hypothetical protein
MSRFLLGPVLKFSDAFNAATPVGAVPEVVVFVLKGLVGRQRNECQSKPDTTQEEQRKLEEFGEEPAHQN